MLVLLYILKQIYRSMFIVMSLKPYFTELENMLLMHLVFILCESQMKFNSTLSIMGLLQDGLRDIGDIEIHISFLMIMFI